MPATAAQIRANQANSARSTGPKTVEGKAASRANSYKHGMSGAGTVVPEREAVEVERRFIAFCEELKPSGEVGMALARQAAMMSVRTERCFEHEIVMLTEKVRQAEADFVPPEGVDAATAAKLRETAGKLALFDTSKEAILARRYEAEARRGFFRSLKEFRTVEKAAKAAQAAEIDDQLASIRDAGISVEDLASIRSGGISPEDLASIWDADLSDEEFARIEAKYAAIDAKLAAAPGQPVNLGASPGRFDVPISIGKAR